MRAAWSGVGSLMVVSALVVTGCGGGAGSDKPSNTAGTSTGGASAGAAGMSSGGSQAQGGSASGAGGSATAGSASGGGGSGSGGAGGSGGAAGSSSKGFTCPAGPFAMPVLSGTPTRVQGVPPADDFNNNNNDPSNIEGAVWIGDALYVSEIAFTKTAGDVPPPSRILKITADDKVSVAIMPNTGTNGLAINDQGELFGAVHKDGSISKFSLTGGAAVPVVSMYMGSRFDSPNDLTISHNGTIYFTDPNYQAPKPPPQSTTRAYRVAPGGMPQPIEELSQPNGITLSKNQDFLYVGGPQLKRYPVMADGSLGAGTTFVQGGQTDGMVIDCADNVYAAGTTTPNTVGVYSSTGTSLGAIQLDGSGQTTNVAFGGADHKTLYITRQSSSTEKGLFKIQLNVPGFPY